MCRSSAMFLLSVMYFLSFEPMWTYVDGKSGLIVWLSMCIRVGIKGMLVGVWNISRHNSCNSWPFLLFAISISAGIRIQPNSIYFAAVRACDRQAKVMSTASGSSSAGEGMPQEQFEHFLVPWTGCWPTRWTSWSRSSRKSRNMQMNILGSRCAWRTHLLFKSMVGRLFQNCRFKNAVFAPTNRDYIDSMVNKIDSICTTFDSIIRGGVILPGI